MRITFLDALAPGAISRTTEEVLRQSNALHAVHRLREERFAPCQGCFECWTDHPGTCKAKDAANDVMRDAIGADALLFATRVRFGCWDPIAKVALDKCIGLLSPFFGTVEGETHHVARYPRYPRCGCLAVAPPTVDERERAAFRRLVRRNALNFHTGDPWVAFVPPDASPAEVRAALVEGLVDLARPPEPCAPKLEPYAPRSESHGVPGRAGPRHLVLWVGSSKPEGESASERLGAALEERLVARGWTAERVFTHRTVKLGGARAPALVEAARRADLLVLAAPVYIDCLPAPVLAGLAHLADARLRADAPTLLPIVQCGFPELTHTALAVDVAWRAAREAGLGWAGHLAMGGGGMVHRPLAESAHHEPQLRALDEAAEALDAGRPVPPEATRAFGTPAVSPALYRTMGNAGWIARAIGRGVGPLRIRRRPFDPAPS
ncbi:MAG: hypothetical protein ACFCGT_04465 [Sandaracinaceae bacterium]